jgi:hypothetical protein
MDFKQPWIKHKAPSAKFILRSGFLVDRDEYTIVPYDELKEMKSELKERRRYLEELSNQKISYKVYKSTEVFLELGIEELQEKIKKKERVYSKHNKVIDIRKAREVPITDFIEIGRSGFIKCLWHPEKTPIMKYYPKQNTLHCFGGCCKSFDVIDVVMNLQGIDFISAVKQLQ